MTQDNINLAMEKYKNQIPKDDVFFFQKHLKEASDDCINEFMSLSIKGSTATLLFSIFLGGIAVDRFYIGDVGVGVGKLALRLLAVLLSGVVVLGTLLSLASSIWCIADIFITYKIARKINYGYLTAYLNKHKEQTAVK